jgi:hypothetical protein
LKANDLPRVADQARVRGKPRTPFVLSWWAGIVLFRNFSGESGFGCRRAFTSAVNTFAKWGRRDNQAVWSFGRETSRSN